MNDIYIIHTSANDATATRICFAFQAAGIGSWVDHIHGSENSFSIRQEREEALNSCAASVLILSEWSALSSRCTCEWQRTLEQGKRLVVAVAEEFPPDDIPQELWNRTIVYVDLSQDVESGIDSLIRVFAAGHIPS